jgi:hypothetical protein
MSYPSPCHLRIGDLKSMVHRTSSWALTGRVIIVIIIISGPFACTVKIVQRMASKD